MLFQHRSGEMTALGPVVSASMDNNITQNGFRGIDICAPPNHILNSIWGVLGMLLFLSLCGNIFCCASRCRSGNAIFQSKKQQRQSSRQMEENPIYGNISYSQTSVTLTAESDSRHSRTLYRLNPDSGGVPQECYANLTLKAPRVQSGHSSPQIEYSDIIQVEDPLESEREEDGCTEGASIVSDLYASVQTQRVKTIDSVGDAEGYANQL